MADAAVEFLLENVKQLLFHHAELIKDAEVQLQKLEYDLRLMKAFLLVSMKKRCKDGMLRELLHQIQNVVFEVEDVIDSIVTQAAETKSQSKTYFFRNFKRNTKLTKQVDAVCHKIKDIYGENNSRLDFPFFNVDDGDRLQLIEVPMLRKDNVVGFEDEADTLMGFLAEETEQLDVISIVGMPGLGKTTLAGKIFHDPTIQYRFPVRIWICVSQVFIKKDIYLSILKEFTRISEDIKHKSDQDLADMVTMCLASGKFLLVMDDVWTNEDWDKLLIALPKGNSNGKVLITTRQVEVSRYANCFRDPHMLRFLTLEESWLLLRLEVFGKPEIPFELEDVGIQITNKCGGLPLAIVVLGGILRQKYSSGELNAMKRYWGKVAKSVNKYIYNNKEGQMENILSLSYEKLPYHLRHCFLYLGMFPGDFEISAWKLIRMWIAEGFIQRRDNISMEKIAESYLDDLINRNLVRVDKLKADGHVKTCRVHDIIRGFCRVRAGDERENFFQEVKMSSDGCFQPPLSDVYKYRRLCIHSNILRFLSEKPYGPSVRSFVCLSKDEFHIEREKIATILEAYKLLRVLDAKPIIFSKLPSELFGLLHLRYLVLTFNSSRGVLPSAISKLWNIQTLVVDTTSRTLGINADIMNMIQLRHFKTNASAILSKMGTSTGGGGEQIQTLGTISPESCSQEAFSKAKNLKKLGIRGELVCLLENKNGSFDSLEQLSNLEELKLINDPILCSEAERQILSLPPVYKFPTHLKSLTLSNLSLDWTHMSVLGTLDKLEVLKLKDRAFWGETWEVTDGGFRHLEMLHIGRTNLETWIASPHHFPRLKTLVLRDCANLREVPIQLADIPNLQLLYLHQSNHAAASAMKICGIKRKQEDQQPGKAHGFKLSIFPPKE